MQDQGWQGRQSTRPGSVRRRLQPDWIAAQAPLGGPCPVPPWASGECRLRSSLDRSRFGASNANATMDFMEMAEDRFGGRSRSSGARSTGGG